MNSKEEEGDNKDSDALTPRCGGKENVVAVVARRRRARRQQGGEKCDGSEEEKGAASTSGGGEDKAHRGTGYSDWLGDKCVEGYYLYYIEHNINEYIYI